MRPMAPRPFLLVLTLLLVVDAIVVIELRFGVAGPVNTQAADPTPAAQEENEGTPAAGWASEGRRDRGTGRPGIGGPDRP